MREAEKSENVEGRERAYEQRIEENIQLFFCF